MSPENAVIVIIRTFLSIAITFVAFAYIHNLTNFVTIAQNLRLFPLTDFNSVETTRSAMVVADFKSGPHPNESWTVLL